MDFDEQKESLSIPFLPDYDHASREFTNINSFSTTTHSNNTYSTKYIQSTTDMSVGANLLPPNQPAASLISVQAEECQGEQKKEEERSCDRWDCVFVF